MTREAPSSAYQTRFDEWDKISWVRAKPRQTASFDPEKYFYSPAVVPLLHHDLVRVADEQVRRDLLVLYLYNYLEFTVWLEMGPVNEVCDLIRRHDFLPWLPPQMKSDAIKIYVDEAGHAEMSHALIASVEEFTGLPRIRHVPAFLGVLDRLVSRAEPEYERLIKMFFTIISETLITGTLVKLPRDATVQQAVRDVALDHAQDEARHHAFFKSVMHFVWPRLPVAIRRHVGVLLPEMILAFLAPDAGELQRMLSAFPDHFSNPGLIANDIVSAPGTHDAILGAASKTLSMFEQVGVFGDSVIAASFQTRNLLRRAYEE